MKFIFFIFTFFCLSSTTGFCQKSTSYELSGIGDWHRGILKKYCQECHNEKKSKGKFRIDNLPLTIKDSPTAELWQKVMNSLNAGEMPPEDEKQIKPDEKADFLDDLAHAMVGLRDKMSDRHGEIAMSRLNQREYRNTLRALLGVDVNVNQLPSDHGLGNFDTNGASLYISSNQIESYLELGKEALEEAIDRYLSRDEKVYKRFEGEYITQRYETHFKRRDLASDWLKGLEAASKKPQNKKVMDELTKRYGRGLKWNLYKHVKELKEVPPLPKEFKNRHRIASDLVRESGGSILYNLQYLKLPKIKSGGYLGVPTLHPSKLPSGYLANKLSDKWPPGKYKIRFRVAMAEKADPASRFIEFGVRVRNVDLMSVHEVTGTLEKPQIIETTLELTNSRKGDDRQIYLQGKAMHHLFHNPRRIYANAKKENGVGPGYFIWIDWIEAEKINTSKDQLSVAQKSLVSMLESKDTELNSEQIKQGIEKFAKEAFRGEKPLDSYVERLVSQYQQYRTSGLKHRDALTSTLAIVLSSPMFLYKSESSLADQQWIQQHELAQRLAYFLWSAPADQTLLDLADRGELSKPEVLRQQTERMLADERSLEMIHAFTDQWLHLDRLDFFKVNVTKHRTYDNAVKLSMRQEVYKTIDYILKENRSIRELLSSDYVVINSLLADYYDIPNVKGDQFRKVKLPVSSPRGGFMGMAAVHLMGSNGDETSPVERGTWILRKLMNQPPPPAPANVPQLSRLSDKALTTRERLVAHQEEPQCASCHRKIDPIGFGLENFDAVGLWRTENSYEVKKKDEKGKTKVVDKKEWTINASSKLYKGPEFKNFQELKRIVASHADPFAQGFAKALVEYGMGRDIGFSDKKVLDGIVHEAKKENYTIKSFIHAMVQKSMFQVK
jgi:hypothetical protein